MKIFIVVYKSVELTTKEIVRYYRVLYNISEGHHGIIFQLFSMTLVQLEELWITLKICF